jgi:hypothetical protein
LKIGRAAANSSAPGAAAILEWIIDRAVEDGTGLQGRFDFPFDYNRVGRNGNNRQAGCAALEPTRSPGALR